MLDVHNIFCKIKIEGAELDRTEIVNAVINNRKFVFIVRFFHLIDQLIQLDQHILIHFAEIFYIHGIDAWIEIEQVAVKEAERVADFPVYFRDLLQNIFRNRVIGLIVYGRYP